MGGGPGGTGRVVDDQTFRAVPRLIEDQADRHPGRPAVSCAGRTLSYRELDELASGLADELAGRGVAAADRVAVLLVNSLELPVVYLALMKLGAVFVPLDPAWPQDRLRTALGVLEPRLILHAGGVVPAPFAARGMLADVDLIIPARRRPAVPLGADDLIYGIFTSGTTGIPKCALNRHGGLANRFAFMTRYFAATGAEVVLQNSGHVYDSSLWQLLWPLTTGGRTVLPTQGEFLNLQRTIDTIAHYGVTATDFVSSIFSALVAAVDGDEAAQRKLSCLRHVVVGGEEINPRAVHRIRELLPDLRVSNGYGPTETSIGMIFHRVRPADGERIPLGVPIDNCYAVIVDDELRPLPAGAVGEIAIGGACLGAGYYANPEATAAAFPPNPFPGLVPGERIYLSGDLGYVGDGGQFYFSGRKDFQVKVGGVRIELGEIEAAAQACPGVRQAVALVVERAGRRSLAVFAAGGPEVTETALRDQLRRTLPRTSLPRDYVVLPAMPLTDGGKADRRALRAMVAGPGPFGQMMAGADLTGRPTHDETLRAFRAALGRPELAADADFLAAGGDSIGALSAVRALTSDHGFDVCVQDLFDYPTATQLALLIESRLGPRGLRDRRDVGAPGVGHADAAESALMDADAAMTVRLPVRGDDPGRELRTILVTGPTGFVGARLVHELLARTDLRVLGLARAADDAQATTRIIGVLAQRGLWQPRFGGRLEGFAAQLGEPGLGLAPRTWAHLARSCDLVLHDGAMVNLVFGYRAHRLVNVRGTAELLRLAMTGRPVPLHYISTLAAFQPEARRQRDLGHSRLRETCDPAGAATPGTGYACSKWVAERQLAQARRRGATVTVLRLGEVLPGQDSPQPNPAALTHLLLSASYRLGISPDTAISSDYTPADYVAARVRAAVLDRAVWGRALHVFHPESVRFDDVLRRAGTPVSRVSCTDFLVRLREAAEAGRGQPAADRELAALAALLPDPARASEETLRQALGALLTDNPALFRKDECRAMEQRWGLADDELAGPVRAYRDYLAGQRAEQIGA